MSTPNQNTTLPLARPRRVALAPARFLGFWSAVVLPMVLLPLLLTGYATANPTPFAALLLANVVAAALGRNYGG